MKSQYWQPTYSSGNLTIRITDTRVLFSVCSATVSVAWAGSYRVALLKTISPHSCSDCSSSLLVTHAKFGSLIVHITVYQRCDSDLDRAVSNSHPRNIISRRFFLVSQVLNLIFSPYFLIRGIFNEYASVCMSIYNQRTHRAQSLFVRPPYRNQSNSHLCMEHLTLTLLT